MKGAYLFHYEQRAFHRLFHTDPWSKQVSVRGTAPYSGAAEVRRHSKIVNQCVFNSLLPWYVSGDFVVHFAGLKGVWECLIFFSYFDKSQEAPGMRVSDAQWAEERGGENRGRRARCGSACSSKRCFDRLQYAVSFEVPVIVDSVLASGSLFVKKNSHCSLYPRAGK